MTIAQLPGSVTLRRNQIGIQSVLGTPVAATRRVPWQGAITVNRNRTNVEADLGSLDPIARPYDTAVEVTWPPSGTLFFNDLPIRLAAALKGGVAPTGAGTAKTWDYQVASLTSDPFDIFTNQFADDTEATDAIIAEGGVINTFEESMDEGLGPWTISDGWIFASAALGANATDSLVADSAGVLVFGADTEVKMDPTAGAISTTKLTNTIHSVTLRINNNLDTKRFANGSNSRFAAAGYSRGEREIELVLTMAKSAAAIAERATYDDDPVPSRFFDVNTTSTVLAEAAMPYKYQRRGAFRLFDVSDVEVNNNTAIQFTYRAYYDATLGYAFRATVVNTQATVAAAPA